MSTFWCFFCQARGAGADKSVLDPDRPLCVQLCHTYGNLGHVLLVTLLKGLHWCSTVEMWSMLQVQANILQILDMSPHSIVASEADYLAAQWAELPELQSQETESTLC